MKCLLDRDRALKVRHGAHRHVSPIEDNLDSVRLDFGALKQVRQTDPSPTAVSHSTRGPLQSGDRWIVKSASVSSTLEHTDQLHRGHSSEIVHRERQWRGYVSLDLQSPLG